MRIALDLSPALSGPSGLRFYVTELLAGLASVDSHNEYLLYAAFWKDPARLDGLKLPQARNFSRAFKRFPQRLLLPADELGAGIQARFLRGLGVDLFHGLGHLAPPLGRVPAVVTVHHAGGLPPGLAAWDRFYFEFLTRRCVRRAKAVICVSDFSRESAISLWGLDPARVTAIHEGGPGPEYKPRRGVSENPYVLHVGSFNARKNIPTLVRAFALWLSREPGRRERLILVGNEAAALPEVSTLVSELGLESRVELRLGAPRAEIVALYQGAEMVAVPSLLEGFGFPVLEAMACGVPVLAARAGSLPEVAGDAALLFDPLDAEGLSRGLARVAGDPELAQGLKERGLRRAAEFSWESAARRTVAVYESVRTGSPLPR